MIGFEAVALFLTGFVAMFYASFAGGGALIIIPILLFMGLGPTAAIATNRFAVWFQGFGRIPELYGKLGIGKKIPLLLILIHSIGGFVGASILVSLPQELMFKVVGVILVLGAIVTYYSHQSLKPVKKKDISKKSIGITAIAMLVLGIYRGLFGPGAGTIGRMISIHFLGLDFIQALTFASYYTFFSSSAALIVFYFSGFIDFSFGIPLALGAITGAFIGTWVALKKGNLLMKNAFVLLALIFGGYFLFFR